MPSVTKQSSLNTNGHCPTVKIMSEKQRWGPLFYCNNKIKIEFSNPKKCMFYTLFFDVFNMFFILEGLIPSFVQTGDNPI